MPKYPEVAQLFNDLFADDLSMISTDQRKALMSATHRSGATVSRWIAGEARPESDAWRPIARVANVSVDRVIAALGSQSVNPRSVAPPIGPTRPDDLWRFVRSLEAQVGSLTQVVLELGSVTREALPEHKRLVALLEQLEELEVRRLAQ